MTGGGQAVLVLVLVALEGGLASVFRQGQAALLPWLARTVDELTSANTAARVMQAAATLAGPAIAAGLLVIGISQWAMLVACALVAIGAGLLVGVRPPMILLAFAHARYWPYLIFAAIGVANVFDDVGVYSALQQVIPSRLMGRALGMLCCCYRWGLAQRSDRCSSTPGAPVARSSRRASCS